MSESGRLLFGLASHPMGSLYPIPSLESSTTPSLLQLSSTIVSAALRRAGAARTLIFLRCVLTNLVATRKHPDQSSIVTRGQVTLL
eukprot:4925304-Pyramimonas_sp.AAC.2